ncbi:hypothetical protein ABS735_33730 [Streptomyces sp. MMCC 100]|uniref:hypothetical protein n=1 Tax=Streptomyces sp. MMCC 100 TaxID=3163555 RepID=UPI00359B6752
MTGPCGAPAWRAGVVDFSGLVQVVATNDPGGAPYDRIVFVFAFVFPPPVQLPGQQLDPRPRDVPDHHFSGA